MSVRDQILATLRKQHQELGQRYPIRRLALFGSWARGDAREDSDASIGLKFVQLAEELELALGRRADVVSRRAIKPEYWELIEPDLIDA